MAGEPGWIARMTPGWLRRRLRQWHLRCGHWHIGRAEFWQRIWERRDED